MKNILFLTTMFLMCVFVGCKNQGETDKKTTVNGTEKLKDTKSNKIAQKPEIKSDREKILNTKYVLAKNGLLFREEPNGIVIDKFSYGKKLEIIEYSGQKQIVEDNGKKLQGEWVGVKKKIGNSQKKVYVFDGFLGDISEIGLLKKDLCLVIGFKSSNSERNFYETGQEICIDSLLKIDVIDKNIFDRLKQNNIDYINRDSTNIVRTKDTLFVDRQKFINIDSGSDGDIKHDYVGKLDFLNKYVIRRYFWENADYIMVNESSGEIDSENQKLIDLARSKGMNRLGLPRISPKKKIMISLESAIYTKQAELNIFEIKNDTSLKLKFSALFKTWSPIANEVYWISDETFIVKAAPINVISEYEYGEVIANPSYLKLTII